MDRFQMVEPTVPRRIYIVGKSGSGKSTLAKKLSAVLHTEHVELDALFWKPNWVTTPQSEMRALVDPRLAADASWIADGNYRFLADITWARAELVIWLDYALVRVLWRLVLRSLRRIVWRERCCGDNYEKGRALYGLSADDNILLCCLLQHRNLKRDMPVRMASYGAGKVLRFRTERECDDWLDALRKEADRR